MAMKNPVSIPHGNADVLAWFGDSFESVFAVLHPFEEVPPDVQNMFLGDGISRADLKNYGNPVTWKHVVDSCDIPSIGHLNVLLQESIGAIRVSDPRGLTEFLNGLDRKGFLPPGEGEFPEELLDSFLQALSDLDYDCVQVGNQLSGKTTVYKIQDMLSWEYPYVREANPVLYPADHRVLFGVHWDSFYTFLCGSKTDIEAIVRKYQLEGFFFTQGIPVYWSDAHDVELHSTGKLGCR